MTTPTTSPGLGIAPPSPSVPPETIFQSSTPEDVKLWVYHFIRQNQPNINSDDAWAIAREVKGRGALILQYSKEDWDKEVPNWGHLIYIQLHQTPKYVVSTTKSYQILFLILYIFYRSIQSSGFSWLYKHYSSSWLEAVQSIPSSRNPISQSRKPSASSSSYTLLPSEPYNQYSLANGLINGTDIQTHSSSDDQGIASGKTLQAYPSEEEHGSQKRLPFHRDMD